MDPGEIADYEAHNATLLSWARRHRASERWLNPTERFKEMHPEYGRKHYEHFSLLAHGDLAMAGHIVEMKAAGHSDPIEPLWRVLLSCYHALAFAARLSELKDRPSATLEAMAQLHAHYAGLLNRAEP